MGFRGVAAEPGGAVFEMEPGPQHYNPIGSVHGGIALTLLDSAMGCAVHTLLEPGVGYTTLEVKTNFVRPITADTGVIRCEGIVLHKGARGRDRGGQLTDANGKLLAHGTTTCLIFRDVSFTTRPELRGTFGMVASTHWLASAAGMSVLERGGNAFDAAVATGLHAPGRRAAPERSRAARCRRSSSRSSTASRSRSAARASPRGARRSSATASSGTSSSPGPACSPPASRAPSAAGCCCSSSSARGGSRTCSRSRSATRRTAFPLVAGIRATIDRTEELLRRWPGSRDLYLPAPEVGALFRNPALAATYRRILDEARGGSREEEIEKARRAWYEGFVAEEIDRFVAAEGGLLTGDDLARWRASLEPVAKLEYRGLTVCKTLPWAAGPVGLQQLALLDGFDLAELSPAELVHVVTECAKLAFADRDALYGDAEVPLETLLSKAYNDERRALVGDDASDEYRRGSAGCRRSSRPP